MNRYFSCSAQVINFYRNNDNAIKLVNFSLNEKFSSRKIFTPNFSIFFFVLLFSSDGLFNKLHVTNCSRKEKKITEENYRIDKLRSIRNCNTIFVTMNAMASQLHGPYHFTAIFLNN